MRTVSRSQSPGASVSSPTLPRASAAVASDSSTPSIEMRPAVGRINPASIRMVVVLPAPFGPSSATISPPWTDSDTSRTATRASNIRDRRSAMSLAAAFTAAGYRTSKLV